MEQAQTDFTVHLEDVEATLAAAAEGIDPAKARERAHFMKTTMPLLGLTVPQQRRLLKRGYGFSGLSPDAQWPIWDHIWRQARTHEAKVQAAFFLQAHVKSWPAEHLWPMCRDWVETVNCWDQSDMLSGVYAELFEQLPDTLYPVYRAWNAADNPWLRRQSLVGLICYARSRTRMPRRAWVFDLVTPRLGDPDYYVQKGLGWTLREAFSEWPRETEAFLQEHVQVLDPAAWQAATEKLDADRKAALKALRKGRSRKTA